MNAAGFDGLVSAHRGEVLRVCRAILRDEHLGADAAQEVFVRLWQRTRAGSGPHSPGAWLRQVAVTSALGMARARTAARAQPADEAVLELAPGREPSQAAALADAELRSRFEAALQELPEGQRTVFLLRHDAGLPLAEVARTLGVGHETVKTQFARAVLKLQSRLKAFDPDRNGP